MGGQLKPSDHHFVLYGLGGGLGHVVRSCRLARALAETGAQAIVLLPEEKAWVAATEGVECLSFERTGNAASLRGAINAYLRASAATDLIVDVRARGVLGELVPLPREVKTTLLLRAYRRDRVADLMASLGAYDRVIDMESNLDWLHDPRVEPGLPLGVQTTGMCHVDALLVDGGEASVGQFLDRVASRIESAGFHAERASAEPASYPALSAWKPRLVIGPAGYQLTYECAAARVWHLAIPRPRAFDDQRARANVVAEAPHDPPALEKRAIALLRGSRTRPQVLTGTYDALARRLIRPRATTGRPHLLQ